MIKREQKLRMKDAKPSKPREQIWKSQRISSAQNAMENFKLVKNLLNWIVKTITFSMSSALKHGLRKVIIALSAPTEY